MLIVHTRALCAKRRCHTGAGERFVLIAWHPGAHLLMLNTADVGTGDNATYGAGEGAAAIAGGRIQTINRGK